MFNAICRFFARHFVPNDDEPELANALFNWKHKK
jgi:hypothetical protein